jgi:transcription antitermination protein NusB
VGSRTKARKRALDILFESDQRMARASEVLARTAADHPLNDYVQVLVDGVGKHQVVIDETIETYAQDWPLDRMPAVDRALARIGCFELLYSLDVPATVVIDEIVTLAADISTDDSPAFLNGLLSRIESIKHRISLD